MKKRVKKLVSLLITLCMVLSMLPVSASAEEPIPDRLEAVSVTTAIQTVPEGKEAPGDATITTANLFLKENSSRIYLEFTDLQPKTSHYITVHYGETEVDYIYSTSDADGILRGTFYPDDGILPVDEPAELTVTIGYDRQYVDGAYVCHGMYQPAKITTQLVSAMPEVTLAEMNSGNKIISTASMRINQSVYLPYKIYDTLKGAASLNADLVGPDGSVYATTVDYKPSVGSTSFQYPGYNEIFNGGSYSCYLSCCYFNTSTMYVAKPLVPGKYDLKIYDGETLLHTAEDLIRAVDCPVVTSINAGDSNEYASHPGMKEARVQLQLANGDPDDFSVEVWYEDEKLGSSGNYRVISANDETATLIYVVPLTEALDYGKYTVKVISDQVFSGLDSKTFSLSQYSTYRTITDAAFGSRYYANVLLTTLGYAADETYQAQFYSDNTNGTPLSTVYVSPDENGLFDIEFTDEAGDLIPITGYGHYAVRLNARNNSGNWETSGSSKNFSNYERNEVMQSVSLLAAEEQLPVDAASANANFYAEDAYVYLRLRADSENYDVMSDLDKFSLRVTGVLGDVYTLTEQTGESVTDEYDDGEKYYALYFLHETVPHGNYTFELLYDGDAVVHANNGKNVLTQSYVSTNDDFPYLSAQSGQNETTGLIYNYGIYGYNLSGYEEGRLDLFTLTNRSTTPDFSFEMDPPAEREWTGLTAAQLAQLSPVTAYRSEVYLDDVPVNAASYAYYAPREVIWMDPDEADTCSVSVANMENGTLTILPATVPTAETTAIPAYTDVYVLAQPAEGYRLKAGSITVNGEALLGRGFPVTEDCVVSAEFEPIPVETYTVTVYDYIYYGTATVDKTKAAAGEKVTLTLTPNSGYVVNKKSAPYYYLNSDTATTVAMTENSDGTWSFTMPAGAVTVRAQFRSLSSWRITTQSNNSTMGTITVSESSALESGTVVVTAAPASGYELKELTYSYRDPNYNEVSGSLLTTPGTEPNTYVLSIPSSDAAYSTSMTVKAVFAERQSYSISNYSSTSAYGWFNVNPNPAYSGDTVTVTANAADGYQLIETSLRACVASSGTEIPLTKQADGSWTFTMPAQEVNLYYEFQQKPLFAPGGNVTSPETLLAALGGTGFAKLENGVVSLTSDVTLTGSLNVTAGTLTLDLNGYLITGAANLLQVSGTADMTLYNSSTAYPALSAQPGFHAVHVTGGQLEIQSGNILIFGQDNDAGNGAVSTILVAGGQVTLGTPDIWHEKGTLSVNTYNSAPALEITGGTVKLEEVDISADGSTLRVPAGNGLKDYLADSCMAFDSASMTELSDAQLSAAELTVNFRVGKCYTVTVTPAQNGRIQVSKPSWLPTYEVLVSVEPDQGYRLKELTYTYTSKSGEQITGTAKYSAGFGYWFPMPRADATVSAVFEVTPENKFLKTDRFSIHSDYWESNVNHPDAAYLDYYTSYASFTLVNTAGEVVYSQENHGVGSWINLNNPGDLTAGKYKLYAVMGDANKTIDLGWQTVELVDSYSYRANIYNGSLSIWSSAFEAVVYVECLPSQLPSGLKLALVDQSSDRVLASSSEYTIRYDGADSSNETASNKEAENDQTALIFRLDLGSRRLSADGSYILQLMGDEELLNSNSRNLHIQNYPSINGSYNENTMLWTGTAHGFSAGTYEAYSNNRVIDGLSFVVADDCSAYLQFASDPFVVEGQSWVNINVVHTNGSVYVFSFSSTQGNTSWYPIKIEEKITLNYNSSYDSISSMIPYPDGGSYILRGSVSGYTGGGTYQVRDNGYGTVLASGALDAQGGFAAALTGVRVREYYQIWVYNEDGDNIAQTDVQFRSDPALGSAGDHENDFYDGDNTLTLTPVNLSAAMANTIRLGYKTLDGQKPLNYTTNSNGTITVDLSTLPSGTFRLWAECTSEDGGTCKLLIASNTIERGNDSASAITVADLKPVKQENGSFTAQVKYEDGTPKDAVLMDIFRLKDDSLTFVSTKNIGTGSYTIDSGELGLSGSYVFYFRSSADNTLLGVKKADFVGTYAVTFLDWDGSILSVQQVAPGTAAQAPEAPTREGYTFTGWSCEFTQVAKNLTVTARYSKDSVIVTFSVGTATGGPAPISLGNGSVLEYPAEKPVREGYTFTGWYTDPRGTNLYKFGKAVTADLILYAGWEAMRYTAAVEGTVEIDLWSDASAEGPFLAGETVRFSITSQADRITALELVGSQGTQSIPVTQESFSQWAGSFTMPAENITLRAKTAAYEGQLTINCPSGYNLDILQVYSPDTLYSVYYTGIPSTSMKLWDLPLGTYYVNATSGSVTWNETVTLTEQTPQTYLNLTANDRHTVSGILSGAVGEDTTLYAYNASGAFAGYADYDSKAGTFSFKGLANGTYTLYAYDQTGQLLSNVNNFKVNGADISGLFVTLTQPLSVKTQLSAPETLGDTAYLVLEKQTPSGEWSWIASQSGRGNNVNFFFDYAITETGIYQVRLDWLTDTNGTGGAFVSEPVVFEVTEEILSTGVYQTGNLSYTANLDVMEAFSGSGNLVALSKNDVYPGDYVELTIRYNAPKAVAPSFTLNLPEGVTRLDSTSLNVTNPVKSGTIVLALKVSSNASGSLAIPVQVTLNGQTSDFGTAAMSVANVTMSAAPSAEVGVPFTVYGEAAAGSTVSIINAENNALLASVPVSGRFYSTQVMLPKAGTYRLEARVASGGSLIKSEPAVVVVESKPISISKVLYDYDTNSQQGTAAKRNAKLDIFSFWQYVDLELMGYDLPLAVQFENGENIEMVQLSFCGKTRTASQNGDTVWFVNFPAGTWGGSGLKTITAKVTANGETYSFDVAMVNLLIDPSGVITDELGQPLAGVTVTCQVYENGEWVDLDAAAIGQVNPQITDAEGRYGWNVPQGKYRVLAMKDGYLPYNSQEDTFGVLDIPPARNDINFSMTPVGGTYAIYPSLVDGADVSVAASAANGELVTLSAVTAEGLLVESVKVTTLSGVPVNVTAGENNTWSFRMPAKDVTYSISTQSKTGTLMEIESAKDDGTVKVSFSKLGQDATLMTAFYVEGGRMVGLGTTDVSEGATSAMMKAILNETPDYMRIFLLDPKGSHPLLACDELSF